MANFDDPQLAPIRVPLIVPVEGNYLEWARQVNKAFAALEARIEGMQTQIVELQRATGVR